MLITLTGMPGSGKTTVGRIVADALGCPFMDLDEMIVKKAGKTIPEFFESDGEKAFREMECKLIRQTVSKYAQSDAVLALGGGSVTLPGIPVLLQEKTLCIWLQASIQTLATRLDDTSSRPLLSDSALPDRLTAMLSERDALYAKAAQVSVETDGLTAEEVADEIIISVL